MRGEILELLKADPFQPFVIRLAGGESYTVRFPGLATVMKDIIYVMDSESDSHSVLRLVQITALDIME